ncbi:hypothetical protein B296_00010588 [Ensete ventricosum]|uniref:Uncharacterized protein n=1 Tax=Ensete ventricosum TaxID=4639 RepID=A0A427BA19_ENSVE|nr:hypothetical protein B296_00010588 [Ensete ventricosum]
MIPLLPLQEFISLIYIQEKFHAFVPYFIFYVDSLHTTWALHQVPPKLFRLSICIELMVTLTPIILRFNSPLSLNSTSSLSVPSFDVALGYSPS